MTLADLKNQSTAQIIEILDSEVAIKLLEFGVLPGKQLEVLNKAPFGGPIYIRIENDAISLRKAEAKTIIVA